MRAVLRHFLSAAGAIALCATAASAQSARPVSFGITGGASVPTGDVGDGLETGYNFGGLLQITPAISPLGLRLEGGYHSFDFDGGNGNTRLVTGIANGVVRFPGQIVRPYLIAGVGAYNVGGEIAGVDLDSETNVGLNGGVGIDIPLSGLSTFVEARYHTVFRDGENMNLVPVTVGIRF